MFKRKNFKCIVAAFVAVIMLCSTTVFATVEQKNATIHYSGIKIVVDGTEIIPTDVSGSIVEPFTISGTTYLPVRALANALGQGVKWDGETKTVYIGGDGESSVSPSSGVPSYSTYSKDVALNYNNIKLNVNGTEIVPKDVNGNIVEPFTIDGTTYLPVRALANALGEEVYWDGETKTVYIGNYFKADSSVLASFSDKTVLTINNTSVRGAFLNMLVVQYCNGTALSEICDNYNPGKSLQELAIDGTPVTVVLSRNILESLVPVIAVYDYAASNGFLEKEQIQTVLNEYWTSYRKQFKTDDEYNSFLNECGVTSRDFEEFIKISATYSIFTDDLYSRYASIPYSDDEFLSICKDKFVTAKHILVGDEETARNIIVKLSNKTSFDSLSGEYNMDPGASPAGYTFTFGEMVPEFEEAAFNLKENQYTQTPVKSAYGYHVIMRLPLDKEWILSNKSTVLSSIALNDTTDVVNKIISESKVEPTEDYDTYYSTIK